MQHAFEDLKKLLGSENVKTTEDCAEFVQCTSHGDLHVDYVVFPVNIEEIQGIVDIARKHKLKVLPLSSGKNWGYGSAALNNYPAIVVHLKRMNRILFVDEPPGTITLESGVTQQQLYDYIREKNLPYLTPVTGSSPDCSIVSNALERGFGITPLTDHYEAITSLTAVLGNGEIYNPQMHCAGGEVSNRLYKWGLGPYLDGLFYRGHFGIVTSATITLAQKPTSMQMFFAEPKSKEDAFALLSICRELQLDYGIDIVGVKLFNDDYIKLVNNDPTNENKCIPKWGLMGCIYAHHALAAPTRKLLKKQMKGYCKKLIFITPKRLDILKKATKYLPKTFKSQAEGIAKAFPFYQGIPNEVGLRAAYMNNIKPPAKTKLNPARDGCGVMWYAPIIPNSIDDVTKFEEMVVNICGKHNILPILNITCNERYIYGLIMITYDKETMLQNATNCKKALIEAGKANGWLPYRVHQQDMQDIYQAIPNSAKQLAALKDAWDPDNIFASIQTA